MNELEEQIEALLQTVADLKLQNGILINDLYKIHQHVLKEICK